MEEDTQEEEQEWQRIRREESNLTLEEREQSQLNKLEAIYIIY